MNGDIKGSYRGNLQLLPASWSFREFQLINCPAHKRTDLVWLSAHVITFSSLMFSARYSRSLPPTLKWIGAHARAGSTWPFTPLCFPARVPLMNTLKGTLAQENCFRRQPHVRVAFPWPFFVRANVHLSSEARLVFNLFAFASSGALSFFSCVPCFSNMT